MQLLIFYSTLLVSLTIIYKTITAIINKRTNMYFSHIQEFIHTGSEEISVYLLNKTYLLNPININIKNIFKDTMQFSAIISIDSKYYYIEEKAIYKIKDYLIYTANNKTYIKILNKSYYSSLNNFVNI